MVAMIAENAEAHTLAGCGHFMPGGTSRIRRQSYSRPQVHALRTCDPGDGDDARSRSFHCHEHNPSFEHLADRAACAAMRTSDRLQPKADLGPTGAARCSTKRWKRPVPSAEGSPTRRRRGRRAPAGGVAVAAGLGAVILYLHGGACVVRICARLPPFAGRPDRFARSSMAFVTDYGLAPERPRFRRPSGIAEATYRGLASGASRA